MKNLLPVTLLCLASIPSNSNSKGAHAVPESYKGPERRPNVIVILSDDQGYGDFSCHGNPVLKTPALDKLYRPASQTTRIRFSVRESMAAIR
jgi:hypothetical protein